MARLILITEGKLDSQIIGFLLNTGDNKLFMVDGGGYNRISSLIRTLYLMYGDEYYYLAVFDSDSDSPSIQAERLSIVKQLSGASMHEDRIGVFCFQNNIESELLLPKNFKDDMSSLKDYLSKNKTSLQETKTIKDIQRFIERIR